MAAIGDRRHDGDRRRSAEPSRAGPGGQGRRRFMPADRKRCGFMVRPSLRTWPSHRGPTGHFGKSSSADPVQSLPRWHDKLSLRSRNDPRQRGHAVRRHSRRSCWALAGAHSKVLVLIEPTGASTVGRRQDIYRALRDWRLKRRGPDQHLGLLGASGGRRVYVMAKEGRGRPLRRRRHDHAALAAAGGNSDHQDPATSSRRRPRIRMSARSQRPLRPHPLTGVVGCRSLRPGRCWSSSLPCSCSSRSRRSSS